MTDNQSNFNFAQPQSILESAHAQAEEDLKVYQSMRSLYDLQTKTLKSAGITNVPSSIESLETLDKNENSLKLLPFCLFYQESTGLLLTPHFSGTIAFLTAVGRVNNEGLVRKLTDAEKRIVEDKGIICM